MQAGGEIGQGATKAAVHMRRRPQERQSGDEEATMETNEHDAVIHKLNVLVQALGHMGQHMGCFCHVKDTMLLYTSAECTLLCQLASADSLSESYRETSNMIDCVHTW